LFVFFQFMMWRRCR